MKVKDIMMEKVLSCSPETNLATAAMEMWDGDCGIIPVVEADRKIKGVITDRDICMAVATKHRRAEEIMVKELLNRGAFTCRPEDDIKIPLKLMAEHRVRRIPVTDGEGRLKGVVSMNDLVLAAQDSKGKKGAELSFEDVMKTIKAICQHSAAATAKASKTTIRAA